MTGALLALALALVEPAGAGILNGGSQLGTSGAGSVVTPNGNNTLTGSTVFNADVTISSTNNPGSSQVPLIIKSSASANILQIQQLATNGSSTNNGISAVCFNENSTCVGIQGHELGVGTLKVVHNYDGVSDANASALSLRYNGIGTSAQGIFLDDDIGWAAGKMLNLRNNGTEFFVVGPTTGAVSIGLQGAANNAQLHVRDVRGVTTNVVQVDDKNSQTIFKITPSSQVLVAQGQSGRLGGSASTVLTIVTSSQTSAAVGLCTFSSSTLPANLLTQQGDCLEIISGGYTGGNADNKSGDMRWDGIVISSKTVVAANALGWQDEVKLCLVTAAGTNATLRAIKNKFFIGTNFDGSPEIIITGVDTTQTHSLIITGTNGTAAAGDMVFNGASVVLWPSPGATQ